MKAIPDAAADTVEALKTRFFSYLDNKDGVDPREIITKIQDAALPIDVTIRKNETTLKEALEKILEIKEEMKNMKAKDFHVFAHFDHALYDLKGKILNLPVYELLGGVRREEIPLEHIVSFLPTPEEVAEEAKMAVDAGYRAIKLHVNREPENAERRVKAVREAIGPDIPLAIDMGMAYNPIDAARLLERLDKECGLNFAEQPLNPYDISGQQFLRSKVMVPLTADHSGMV